MRFEQRRMCRVVLAHPASPVELAAFLARPVRPLRGLLDPARLQLSGPGLYDYLSRPYGVAGWTLQPRVRLRTHWDGTVLVVEQVACRVEGLSNWQNRLRFGLEARLRPAPASESTALLAEALVWGELAPAAGLVAGPVLKLGMQQLLDRLEGRCQRGLRRRAENWLQRQQRVAGSNELSSAETESPMSRNYNVRPQVSDLE
jgi:hypothetical protein